MRRKSRRWYDSQHHRIIIIIVILCSYSALVGHGVLLVRGVGRECSWWFAVPRMSRFTKSFTKGQKGQTKPHLLSLVRKHYCFSTLSLSLCVCVSTGRAMILQMIKRSKYKEILQRVRTHHNITIISNLTRS